jgi:molybdopterin molybdotransferase
VEDAVRDGVWVTLPDALSGGMHIAPAGCECSRGRVVARAGSPITPLVVANLAALGHTNVLVAPRPRCCVLTTGPEIVAADEPLHAGHIRDSNGPMLQALLHEQGVDRVRRLHADDKPEALHRALDQAADDDLVLITGGVSAGRYDLVPRVLAERGVSLVFHKVRQRPGKPLLFGRLGHALYFGLPGNPLASHLGFHRYVAPAIARMSGMPALPRVETGRLMKPLRADAARTVFQLCRVVRADDGWQVQPLTGKGSADIFTACPANALVRVEPGQEGIARNSEVVFTWLAARGQAVTGGNGET